ncbi:UDP-glucose 4-epimerase [candidate division MSBL1 archaeon SCGC-AAA261F19]|uniref:UDP-glucose 4-epimerase n=1 Tax=candidate division MSBL1 archaeon SCGC-AAA261F19 TaxID=1698275 RepID=A0A133VBR4_9EURY|nr:UDP-glucose 4-epimerase [candidate division MSBL1 archaeon SCGC-AAA261F19]
MPEDEKVLVTGGAGFIGSHLVDRLVEKNDVTVVDDFSTGRREFLNPETDLVEGSLLELDLEEIVEGKDIVFHMAANPEVRDRDPKTHIDQNFMTTFRLLEAMRKSDVGKIVFASSSTVYGEADIPTTEEHPTFPISLYGASKLASEALISFYCHAFDLKAWVYRFANAIGPRLRHGVIHDFIQKLRKNPEELAILGNGKQRKSYIYVDDCVKAMLIGLEAEGGFYVFNIGTEDQVEVTRIAEIVSRGMGLNPTFNYTGGKRGWKGDVPVMLLSSEKLRKLGWRPKYKSEESVRRATRDLLNEV